MSILNMYGEACGKVMQWERNISPSDEGEVGRVYYMNFKVEDSKGIKTLGNPFTLNPKYGSTIEKSLKAAKEIPNGMKADLLRDRRAEAKLSNGKVFCVWISEEPAPKNWYK